MTLLLLFAFLYCVKGPWGRGRRACHATFHDQKPAELMHDTVGMPLPRFSARVWMLCSWQVVAPDDALKQHNVPVLLSPDSPATGGVAFKHTASVLR